MSVDNEARFRQLLVAYSNQGTPRSYSIHNKKLLTAARRETISNGSSRTSRLARQVKISQADELVTPQISKLLRALSTGQTQGALLLPSTPQSTSGLFQSKKWSVIDMTYRMGNQPTLISLSHRRRDTSSEETRTDIVPKLEGKDNVAGSNDVSKNRLLFLDSLLTARPCSKKLAKIKTMSKTVKRAYMRIIDSTTIKDKKSIAVRPKIAIQVLKQSEGML